MIDYGTALNLPNKGLPNSQRCQILFWHWEVCLQRNHPLNFTVTQTLWTKKTVELPSFGKISHYRASVGESRGRSSKSSGERGAVASPSLDIDLMLYLECKRGGFQFGDMLRYKPEHWGEGLALHSISDVPDVGFVTVRLSVLILPA